MKNIFVLNSHIPQSDRPWAYEALFHTYLPLFDAIKNRPVTMGFSPQLIYEFTSKDFKSKVLSFMKKIEGQTAQIEDPALKKYFLEFYQKQHSLLESAHYQLHDLWKDNSWEILAYPATHCVMPLLSENLIRHLIHEGESVLKEFFGVKEFRGIWLPEMAFEDSANRQREILAERYDYIFGNWSTVKGFGTTNRLYQDESGLHVVIRNDRTQQAFWGNQCRIAGFPDFRECHRLDSHGNKIFSIGGGYYYPEETGSSIQLSADIIENSYRSEIGDYCAIMCDTEYLGHYFWEGVEVFSKILNKIGKETITASQAVDQFKEKARPISLEGASYTWGSMGDDRSNSNLESWVNGKTHRFLQYYREAMIRLSRYSPDELKKKAQDIRTFFSSDWIFMITFDNQDIHDPSFSSSRYAREKLMEIFNRF
jgi:predicted glycosyl hydrolase (DUF1957 family)